LFLHLVYESVTGKNIILKISSQVRKLMILSLVIVWFGYWLVRFIMELQS
jgi:hypothetical protein